MSLPHLSVPLATLLTGQRWLAGSFCSLGSVEALELLCAEGLDFVVVDGEHGPFSAEDMTMALRAAEAAGVHAIGRIPAHGHSWIERLLDAGYLTLLIPMVNSAAEAAQWVRSCHYPPLGMRSQSGCRASALHPDYRNQFNARFSLLLMVEHRLALPELDSMLALPGVAGCFFGGTDLASSYEGSGLATSEAVAAARQTFVTKVRSNGKIAAIAASDAVTARRYRDEGFQLVTIGSDRRLLTASIADAVRQWKTQ